jgi:hypothetical protein
MPASSLTLLGTLLLNSSPALFGTGVKIFPSQQDTLCMLRRICFKTTVYVEAQRKYMKEDSSTKLFAISVHFHYNANQIGLFHDVDYNS